MSLSKKYRILVVDSDFKFLYQLTEILEQITKKHIEHHFEMNVVSANEKETTLLVGQYDLIFFEADLLLKSEESVLANLFQNNLNSIFVLLFADYMNATIKEIITAFKKYRPSYFGEHLLKGNITRDMLVFFCSGYIERMLHQS